jgi:hypothetical protein
MRNIKFLLIMDVYDQRHFHELRFFGAFSPNSYCTSTFVKLVYLKYGVRSTACARFPISSVMSVALYSKVKVFTICLALACVFVTSVGHPSLYTFTCARCHVSERERHSLYRNPINLLSR